MQSAHQQPLVQIDFPSFIRNQPKVASRKLENIAGEAYHLIETFENGRSAIYTVNPASPVVFRGVDVRNNAGNRTFLIELRLNEAAQSPIPELPIVKKIGAFFSVEKQAAPETVPELAHLVSRMSLLIFIDAKGEAAKMVHSISFRGKNMTGPPCVPDTLGICQNCARSRQCRNSTSPGRPRSCNDALATRYTNGHAKRRCAEARGATPLNELPPAGLSELRNPVLAVPAL